MKDNRHRINSKKYIITQDLGERIESLRLLGIATPDAKDPLFSEFHLELKNHVSKVLPELEVITYDMEDLVDQIWTKAIRIQDSIKDAVILSSCAEVANVRRGHTIEINRIVDFNGKVIGLGPRPGHPSLDHQLNAIASISKGSHVVLVEDGIFTGTTIEYLIRELATKGVSIHTIVAGLSFPGAKERISKVFKGEIVIVREVGIPYEWMPDHDFIPFAPNCGRVFGGVFGREILPYYDHNGMSYSIPYVLPFGDPVRWASIPESEAFSFSMFCLDFAVKLFCNLDSLNKKKIKLHDLMGSAPRISLPITKGSGQLPNHDMAISEFLSDVRRESD